MVCLDSDSKIISDLVLEKYGQKFAFLIDKLRKRREKSIISKSNFSLNTKNLSPIVSCQNSETECEILGGVFFKKNSNCNHDFSNNKVLINQVSKALHYCRNVKQFNFSKEHIYAEKLYLISTLKRSLDENQKSPIERPMELKVGVVEINRITFFIGKRKHKEFYVCAANYENVLKSTEIVAKNQNGSVCFENKLVFSGLPVDFEICIALFVLNANKKLKKDMVDMSHSFDYNFPFQSSLFKLYNEFKLNLQKLPKGPVCSILLKNFVKFECKKSFNLDSYMHSGFLTLAKYEKNSFPFWNLFYCRLEGSLLKYWRFPDEQHLKPMEEFDLNTCTNFGISDKYRLLQNIACMFLKFEEETLLVQTESVENFHCWYYCFNLITSAIFNWRS